MSLIKAIRAQLGLSVTPANNFTLDASADNGTMKLARGNAGATTQDLLTVDASGEVSLPSNSLKKLASAPGSAPVYGCRAWAVFAGATTGTNPPTAGGNVASVTRNSTGNYTIAFTTPMSDANYAVLCQRIESTGTYGFQGTVFGRTVSGFSLIVEGSGGAPLDPLAESIVVFQ